MGTDTEITTAIKNARQRVTLLAEDLDAIEALAGAGGEPTDPQDPDPTDPAPWYGDATDAQIWERIKARFVELADANGYPASEGYPAASGSDADREIAAAEWTELARAAASWDDVDAAIKVDIAKYWPPKSTGGGTTPTEPSTPTQPSTGDEALTLALIDRLMKPGSKHEVRPSIAEVAPTWGILNGLFTPDTNPTGTRWGSTPPNVSDREGAMPWFVVSGIEGQPNTSDNTATQIFEARAWLWTRDGRRLESRGHDDGRVTLDSDLVWRDDDPPPLFVGGNKSVIRGIGDKRIAGIRDGKQVALYANRSWHPTMPQIRPGGRLSDVARSFLIAVDAALVPIDASKPFDWEKANQSLYAGVDNYSPQQDGGSGLFRRLTNERRIALFFWGDRNDLVNSPPPIAGWQA